MTEYLRAFDEWVDWGMQQNPEVEGKLSQLLECSDIMPWNTVDELDMRPGSTYALAAQRLLTAMEPMRRALHEKREARVAEIMRLLQRFPPERRERELRAARRRSSFRLVAGGKKDLPSDDLRGISICERLRWRLPEGAAGRQLF